MFADYILDSITNFKGIKISKRKALTPTIHSKTLRTVKIANFQLNNENLKSIGLTQEPQF